MQVKKSRRGSLEGTEHKIIEAERSGAIGQRIMEKYDSGRGVKYVRKRNNKKILDEISIAGNGDLDSKKLLDVGCGFGDFLADAQAVMDKVYGADMSHLQAQKAKKRALNRPCVSLADGENLPFKSGCFDFIVMKGLIHHLGSPDHAFKEAKRLLKDSGTLVILEGTPTSWYRRFFLFIADMIGMEHEVSLFPLLSAGQICDLLQENGFQTEHKKVSGFFAAFGLAGFGGEALWKRLNRIEDMLEARFPLFDWFNLIAAATVMNSSPRPECFHAWNSLIESEYYCFLSRMDFHKISFSSPDKSCIERARAVILKFFQIIPFPLLRNRGFAS